MSEVNQTRIQCKPVREVTKMCNLSAVWCITLLLTGMFSFFVAIFRYSAPHSCNGRTRVLTIKKKLPMFAFLEFVSFDVVDKIVDM